VSLITIVFPIVEVLVGYAAVLQGDPKLPTR
jgi:hypothetical protein